MWGEDVDLARVAACVVAYVVLCKAYNVLLAPEPDDHLTDLLITKTSILAIVAVVAGAYALERGRAYKPPFSAVPSTTRPTGAPASPPPLPLQPPKLTRLVAFD